MYVLVDRGGGQRRTAETTRSRILLPPRRKVRQVRKGKLYNLTNDLRHSIPSFAALASLREIVRVSVADSPPWASAVNPAFIRVEAVSSQEYKQRNEKPMKETVRELTEADQIIFLVNENGACRLELPKSIHLHDKAGNCRRDSRRNSDN